MSRPVHAIYANELICNGCGYPLWIPQPNSNRRYSGLLLGDVGRITEDGAFEALTNLFYPDPQGSYGIKPLDPASSRLDRTDNVISQVGGEILSMGGSRRTLTNNETVTCVGL